MASSDCSCSSPLEPRACAGGGIGYRTVHLYTVLAERCIDAGTVIDSTADEEIITLFLRGNRQLLIRLYIKERLNLA